MSKYIDLNEATDLFKGIDATMTGGWVADTLEALPTIDIVNCIGCAYLGDDYWCYKHEFTPIPTEDYFCKDGERIEEL